MSAKPCADCGVTKPFDQFAVVVRPGRRPRMDSWCRICRKQYATRRAAERRYAETQWNRIQPKALRKLRRAWDMPLKEREVGG